VVDHEQVALDRLAQPGVELLVCDPRHLGEQFVGRLPGQLRNQAGLAHTSLARHDREPRLVGGGALKQCRQRRDLRTPPDEDRALHRLAHTLHGATTGPGAGTGYCQHQDQQALSTRARQD
jgi:hypothetical protein